MIEIPDLEDLSIYTPVAGAEESDSERHFISYDKASFGLDSQENFTPLINDYQYDRIGQTNISNKDDKNLQSFTHKEDVNSQALRTEKEAVMNNDSNSKDFNLPAHYQQNDSFLSMDIYHEGNNEKPNDFILQDPPLIKGSSMVARSYNDVSGISRESMLQNLSSPISQLIKHDHTGISPQLPPPLTATPIQKLTFSNGEEFSSVRRGLATDLKAPAEYTLHIIFTQFVRHAERKLNLCLDYPVLDEPPIIDLLGEGADPLFDKIIASLGYIARKKPKQVIDSVMFWRKSKSDVAVLAADEVERVLSNARSKISNLPLSQTSPSGIQKNAIPPMRTKRSLSLMRSKSISKISHRRNESAASAPGSNAATTSPSKSEDDVSKQRQFYDDQIAHSREIAIQAERKSLASIYILCRVLIEAVKQATKELVGDDLNEKLEEIVYSQLKTTDPISTSESLVRLSNWNLFAELLGFMSEQRFLSVSDRFIADLEKVPSNIKQEDEPRLHLLIHGMRYLRLTHYPLDAFEESAEFMASMAKFFDRANNESIIMAYCEVFSNLLMPLANILTAEVNHPTWVEAIERIFKKAYRIWHNVIKNNNALLASSNNMGSISSSNTINTPYSYNNSWGYSVNLMVSTLSVSTKQFFSENWFKIIEENMFKLKQKTEVEVKTTFIVSISRLVWVYLNRLPDTLNNTVKRLDTLFLLLFFNGISSRKNQWISLDVYLINSMVELVRIVANNHLNYILENILIKLLKLSFNTNNLENAIPERIIFVIKSYLAILEDAESGKKIPYPSDELIRNRIILKRENRLIQISDEDTNERREFTFMARNSNNKVYHDELCRSFGTMIKLLDSQYGAESMFLEGSKVSTPLSGSSSRSQSPFSSFYFNLDFSYNETKDLHVELFASLIEAVPWTLVSVPGDTSTPVIPFKSVIEILTRNILHSNIKVAHASVNALKELSSRNNPSNLITMYAKIAFQFSDKPNPNYKTNFLNSPEFHRLLKVYVDLLNCWLSKFHSIIRNKNLLQSNPLAQNDESMNNDVLNNTYQINQNTYPQSQNAKPIDELEWKAIITVIEEVEGNGLFFLCSQDAKCRHFAIQILKLVDLFDQAIYNMTDKSKSLESSSTSIKGHSRSSSKFAADVGTRLINILEDLDVLELIQPVKKDLSAPERNRIQKFKNKKKILLRLAESDYGIDSTIWFRIFPKLLDVFFEKCPMPVAMCRSIVCVRLVQMHESIFEFSESYKNYTSIFSKPSTGFPPELLVIQWKLYLIFACCSLTSTNEQKMSLPNQPTHGRKRSMQMFIQHQKITSATSIFRMVMPFLKSRQSMVKDAVISSLGCINQNIFKTFLENIPENFSDWHVEQKQDKAEDLFRVEIVRILWILTTRFRFSDMVYSNEWIIANLISIIKNIKMFLSIPSTQVNIDFQKLRRYFCGFLENIYLSLQDKLELNKWFPFEARIGCFNYLKEWCEYGDESDLADDRYSIMAKDINSQKQSTSIALLEIERKHLKFASLSCMAALCNGPIRHEIEVAGNIAVISFDLPGIFSWIKCLLSSKDERIIEIGKTSLNNVLFSNLKTQEIYDEIVKQCYSSQGNLNITAVYFTTFVENYLKYNMNNLESQEVPYDIICLASYLIGNDNYDIRASAVKLLRHLEEIYFGTSTVEGFVESITSRSVVVYKKALFGVSNHAVSVAPDNGIIRICYLTKYFNEVDSTIRKDIISTLLPWIQVFELNYVSKETSNKEGDLESGETLTNASTVVLNNLFEITIKFGWSMSNEVEALWVALSSNTKNFDIIVDYLVSNCLKRRNPLFIEHSKQVIDYLAFSRPDPLVLIDKFLNNLQTKSMVPPQPGAIETSFVGSTQFPYVANLWKVIPYDEKDVAFSVGQLSIIFLVDLFSAQNLRMVENLPLLVHVSFSLLDHYSPIVQELASSMLIHLIQALAPHEPKSEETISALRNKDRLKYIWIYDDLNNDKKGARTPRNMDYLVRNILEILNPVLHSLQEQWSRVSLSWATTCAVRHIACRSFQVFRSLLSFLDQAMLKDMLHRLSNTISDESLDIQGFAMQILMTLNAITAELDSEKLIDFPQLFWSSVACLSTIHEQEFIEVLSTMSKFVSKIDLDSPDTVSCLISTFPPKWEGKFEGLQQIVMVGLRSATAWDPAIKFLDKLDCLKDSEIIGIGDSRLLMSILAHLPYYLHSLNDSHGVPADVVESAISLSKMAENNNKHSLSRILLSLAKNRFRSKKDFLVQTVNTISNIFFPEFEAQTLVLLLGFLSNKLSWVKLETISLLKHILPLVDLQRDEFVGVGADLISPLLRLLLTDYAEPALEVLDETEIISGSQLDKDVLRMSLGNTSIKKEYEKTATLFGIPEESGWAIPMPAVTAASTRNNVHAVFSTCIVATVVDEDEDDFNKDEEIHFHLDDYNAPVEYAETISMSVDEPDASLSNMWAALDDFDSFFTKDSENNGLLPVNARAYKKSDFERRHVAPIDLSHPMESVPNVYEKKASYILNKSLARTKSNSSFRVSLADSIGTANYNNYQKLSTSKKSYIPFRGGKNNFRNPNPMLSPGSQNTDIGSPIMSSNLPPRTQQSSPTFSEIASQSDNHSRSILGNKKRSKKSTKSSPHTPNMSTMNENNSGYWNKNTNSDTSPKAPMGQNTPKVKDKKKGSQIFR